ncbi:DUF3306 domain-containing protein [Loktanella sp. D2R18]|uniref:DUF3306 domain-containing protein n=1 Tax=Rhodobacterales TaxID=204455 RepID=UPI000DE8D97A|nr:MULTISPECIES: DUF3306 domain-containing protein [Rhodobacterales]MDO6591527.1 DUF3306 domain-containing protein [Yoonia sp. 1_MG-2023]RBW43838.1 DUF3306 domain-containing protein [Loktanella sp. D2R18]
MTEDFWTRRKAQVAAEAQAVAIEEHAAPEPDFSEMSDAEVLAALELPDPDQLVAGDDIKGFMLKNVPDHLRRRALRKLWRLNPVLANVDGLVDYGQDFTDNAMVVDGLQTAYQVGKGMMAHLEKLTGSTTLLESDEAAEEEISDAAIALVEAETLALDPVESVAEAAVETSAPPRRRMRFDIAQEAAV